jgi:hypothetical protein
MAKDKDFFGCLIQLFEIHTNFQFPFFFGTTTMGDNHVALLLVE